jgi:hypothetical protein
LEVFILKKFILYFKLFNFTQALWLASAGFNLHIYLRVYLYIQLGLPIKA